jgi:hypothetical protein
MQDELSSKARNRISNESRNFKNLDNKVILDIINQLEDRDVLIFCNSNTKLRQICKKFSNQIWIPRILKLAKEKGIKHFSVDEIIGQPLSFYFGLKNKIKQYYFIEMENILDGEDYLKDDLGNTSILINRLEPISKEEAHYEPHFKIYGIERPKGTVYVTTGDITAEYETFITVAVAKTKEVALQRLINNIRSEIWDIPQYIVNQILKMNIEDKSLKNIDAAFPEKSVSAFSQGTSYKIDNVEYMGGIGGDIPSLIDLEIVLIKVELF